MDLRKALNEAHSILAEAKVAHALIGGLALAVYGHYRATVDIDLLADGAKRDVIKKAFVAKGFRLRHASAEVLQFDGPGFIDILLANRPLSQEMLKRAVPNSSLGVYVLKAEDIVGLKIQAYKNDPSRELQDKADIQKLLVLPGLETEIIKTYADLFDEWPTIRKLGGLP